jgi:hypothetical protein
LDLAVDVFIKNVPLHERPVWDFAAVGAKEIRLGVTELAIATCGLFEGTRPIRSELRW